MAICSRRTTPITAIAVEFLLRLRPMSIQGILPEDVTTTPDAVSIRLRRKKGNGGQRNDRVLRVPVKPASDPATLLFSRLARCSPGRVLFPFTAARCVLFQFITVWLNRALIRLSRQAAIRPPPLGRFTCRSLRSGCISACRALRVPLPRIMVLSGHSSSQVPIRHYLDVTIPPCSDARDLFGRFLPPTSS
jgi:hypothetical protein